MINFHERLLPNHSAAGVTIGQAVAQLLEQNTPSRIEERIGCRVLDFGAVWVFDRHGKIFQVCVWEGYHGKIADTIGIGSSIAEIEAMLGPVEELESDEYGVAGVPGWCFDVEEG